MKKILILSAIAVSIAASAQYADPYKVMLPTPAELNGQEAFLINYDTGNAVDSVVIADNMAVFEGTVDEPFAARINYGGNRSRQFIVENGAIAFTEDGRKAFGSPLNDVQNQIIDSISTFTSVFSSDVPDTAKEKTYSDLIDYLTRKMNENIDNPVGYSLFLELAYEMEPKELIDFVDANPSMAKYERVKKLVDNNRKKAATSVGAKYIDFDIEGKKLSDYVGNDGKYLLVDFFASWCGPCMKQLPVLKELYNEYRDKLNVLGVAVWDEPEATLRTIEREQLPWPCIINAGTVPTDIYGISGIPCIMLISPDGTILSRDLQGDELKAAVAEALK